MSCLEIYTLFSTETPQITAEWSSSFELIRLCLIKNLVEKEKTEKENVDVSNGLDLFIFLHFFLLNS